MNMQKWAWTFGIVFLLIGILGFIPGVTQEGGLLLGIFSVDTMHNVVHLLSGVIAVWTALSSAKAAQMYFRIFGIVYAIVTVIGFIQGDSFLGMMATNTADNILHLVIAVVALWLGYGMDENATTTA